MLLPPINFIFKLLQQHSVVQIWLYEQVCPFQLSQGLFPIQLQHIFLRHHAD